MWCLSDALQVFGYDGRHVRSFGDDSRGQGSGQFTLSNTQGVATDRDGNIIVCDRESARIQVLTAKGRFVTSFGSPGRKNGAFEFCEPVAVHVDREGRILVGDLLSRVQVFAFCDSV